MNKGIITKSNLTEIVKPKKIDKTFKMGKKEFDLSKTMGGLSREEFDALDTMDRKRLNRRMTIWASQNRKEWAENIRTNGNSVSLKSNNISEYPSYDDEGEVVTMIQPIIMEKSGKTQVIPVNSGSSGSSSGVNSNDTQHLRAGAA